MKTAEAKRKLLGVEWLLVREKKYFIVGLSRGEVLLKVHWVSPLVHHDTIQRALEGFGRLDGVAQTFGASKDSKVSKLRRE